MSQSPKSKALAQPRQSKVALAARQTNILVFSVLYIFPWRFGLSSQEKIRAISLDVVARQAGPFRHSVEPLPLRRLWWLVAEPVSARASNIQASFFSPPSGLYSTSIGSSAFGNPARAWHSMFLGSPWMLISTCLFHPISLIRGSLIFFLGCFIAVIFSTP